MAQSKEEASMGLRMSKIALGSPTSVPVFLRKIYSIVAESDESIVSWWDDGSTFVVKNTEKFASEVIPEYFEHNNISSFVRQLNFYGFRKIKSESLRLTDANDEESKYWKFKHEHFRKGRPELLVNIKKAAHGASSDKQEIAGLRNEMKDLKANVMNLEDEVEELRALVADAMKVAESEVDSKKRKLTAANQQAKPQKIQQLADAPTRLGAFEDVLTGDMDVSCSKPSPHQAVGGLASLVALEDETITAILSQEEDLNIAGLDTTKTTSRSDSKQAEKIRSALNKLPQSMQVLFVDRLVTFFANPGAANQQVEAISSLVVSAAEEAQDRFLGAGRIPTDRHCAQLASAILEAYLQKHSRAQGAHQHFPSESPQQQHMPSQQQFQLMPPRQLQHPMTPSQQQQPIRATPEQSFDGSVFFTS